MISARGRRTQRKLFDATRNRSEERASWLGEPRTFSYGASAVETLDLYATSAPAAPIHIFIHGGAWRLLSKSDSSFAAGNFVRSGIHFIALDFAQLPSVSLGGMVTQVRRAVAWIYENARKFDGDPSPASYFGSFVGWPFSCLYSGDRLDFGVWPTALSIVKSAICASGIYDLRPVRLSARNDYVKLDAETEHALSPIRHLDRLSTSVFVGCGTLESDEFKRQSQRICGSTGSVTGRTTCRIAGA